MPPVSGAPAFVAVGATSAAFQGSAKRDGCNDRTAAIRADMAMCVRPVRQGVQTVRVRQNYDVGPDGERQA